jgi:hypothetical protein
VPGKETEGEVKKCFCFWKGFLGIICYYLIVAGFVGVKDAWGNRTWFSVDRGQIIEARVAQIETDDPPFRGNVNPSFLFVITKDDRFTHHQGPDNVLIGRKFIYEDGGSVIEFGGEIMVKVYGPPEVVGKLPLGCFPP